MVCWSIDLSGRISRKKRKGLFLKLLSPTCGNIFLLIINNRIKKTHLLRPAPTRNYWSIQQSSSPCTYTLLHPPWWRLLKGERWLWRRSPEEAGGGTHLPLHPLSHREKKPRCSLKKHFLTVRGLSSGDPSGPRRARSLLNHWRLVVAGRWTLHTSLAWLPTSTVVFSGKPGWRVGRCTLESGRRWNKRPFKTFWSLYTKRRGDIYKKKLSY